MNSRTPSSSSTTKMRATKSGFGDSTCHAPRERRALPAQSPDWHPDRAAESAVGLRNPHSLAPIPRCFREVGHGMSVAMPHRMIRRFRVPFLFIGLLSLSACSGSPGPTDTTPAPGATAALLTSDRPAHPQRGPGGPRGPEGGPIGPLLETALRDLDLSEAKTTALDDLRQD